MEKAIAVVVSYNRLDLLIECIDALRAQTHKLDGILVVNNGSTDNTEDWLRSQRDIFHITQANLGSGGGFNTGINWAFKSGYSWIWCMDDDGYPKSDALEKLLVNQTGNISLLNCAVVNKIDKSSFVWKTKKYKTIQEVNSKMIAGVGHPFNGTLIHRNIVEKVGIPKASLFLWGDETEYYYRIVRKHAIPVYTITESIHYHPPRSFQITTDWDFNNSWKVYYYVRNRFHILKAKHRIKPIVFLHYACFLAAFAALIVLFQKTDKVKKLSFIKWPTKDAISHDFNATPSLILAKLRSHYHKDQGNVFQYLSRNMLNGISRIFYIPRDTTAIES